MVERVGEAGQSHTANRVSACRLRGGGVSAVALVCLLVLAAGWGCVGPKVVLRFRPPSPAEPVVPLLEPMDRPQLRAYVSRDLRGTPSQRVRESLLGPPHEVVSQPGGGESWLYTFVRMPLGRQVVPDARLIGRYAVGHPESFRVALSVLDDAVQNVQMLWFDKRPVLAFEIESLLGRPDRRETTNRDERIYYRYVCFTQHERPSGAVTYVLSTAMLMIPVGAEGNSVGTDVLITDQTRLSVRVDGTTEDPSIGQVWRLRPNFGGTESQVVTPVDIVASDTSRLQSPGVAQAVFGWPTETLTRASGPEPLTFAMYPLERERSVPAHLVVTYAATGTQTVVRNLGIRWQGGLPRDPANLRLQLGSPDRLVGSAAGGIEQWVYEYRIAGKPPVIGTPRPIVYGIRLTFSIRNGVEVMPNITLERTSLTSRR